MIDEKKLIEEIKSCTTRTKLDGMREKIIEFWDETKNIESYKRVQSELIKTKNTLNKYI